MMTGRLITGARRRLPVWRLRARLFFTPRRWLEQASRGTVAGFDWTGRRIETGEQAALSAVRAIPWRKVALAVSAPFVLPSELRAALVRILAYLGAIAAMSLLAAELVRPPDTAGIAEPEPRPDWITVDRPWPAFELALPGAADEKHYAIRRHAAGGGRKDILSFGELGRSSRFLTLEIYRAGQEADAIASGAEAMRAIAAEHGRVTGLRGTLPIASKFGPLQAFEFAVGPFNGYHCVGFLRSFDTPRVRIGGMSCHMNLVVDRGAIACALDRLTLLSAGSDPEIAQLFAQAELKRTFCGQRDPLMYATPRRPGDAAGSARLRLRGRLTAR